MINTVLIADKSVTTQKIIQVTFSDLPYAVESINNIEELNKWLTNNNNSLLLISNSFNDNKTLELTKSLKSKHSNVKIILIHDAFDNINSEDLSEFGIDAEVTKPLDSKKCLDTCIAIIDSASENSEEDQWTINNTSTVASIETEVNSNEQLNNKSILNNMEQKMNDPLTVELKKWGIEVPNIIGNNDIAELSETPSVIDNKDIKEDLTLKDEPYVDPRNKIISPHDTTGEYEVKSKSSSNDEDDDVDLQSVTKKEAHFELGEQTSPLEFSINTQDEIDLLSNNEDLSFNNDNHPSILDKMTSIDDLNFTAAEINRSSENEFDEVTVPRIDISDQLSPDDFWSENETETETDDDFPEPQESYQASEYNESKNIDKNEIVNQIIKDIKPLLDSAIEKYCRETIEKVSWEIIPDLAENLIKEELEKITTSLND